MILSSIQLKNFRSHKNTELNFSDKINYIVGGNGQGKTTILEAIYYLCTTKGYNSKNENEVLRFNDNEFELRGIFNEYTADNVRIYFSKEENKKYYFQNNKQINKHADVIGKFPVVILSPLDHSITLGTPADRRKFVDSILSQASETYLNFLMDYNRTLRQRSSLLSRIKEKFRIDRNAERNILFDELDAWTSKLKETGMEIIKHRIKFVKDFNDYIKDSYKVIMEQEEQPKINYFFLDGVDKTRNIEERYTELLKLKREEELRRAVNLVGPHRDDFVFEINSLSLKTFGSQGQNKTFQVVLRFAQFFYLKEITGRKPIFLLDDVFGELDIKRASKISEYLRDVGQAFITLTDFTNLSFLTKEKEDLIIKVNQGNAAYA